MLAFRFMQEGPNTSLSWLLYALLGFMVVVILVGALTSRQKNGTASKSTREAEESTAKPKTILKSRKVPSRKKSK